MVEDKQLIRQYAAERSEPAFAELVRRHLKMVYAAALRQVNGDTHLAEDVAQTVFADFARKAKTLQHSGSIAGWLFVSTRFAAANAVRAEARRRAREQEAVAMNGIVPNENDGWSELRPMIDEALGELGETDREAIVLRYFEAYEYSLVGAALGVSENAARMRVDRALEKLRAVLQERGCATTGAALSGVLAASSATAAPAHLAAHITSAALAQTATTAASSTTSILKLLLMKKIALVTAVALAVALATVVVVKTLPKPPPQTPAVAADDWLKEEPGVKKFQAQSHVPSVGPDQSVILGGWSPHPGKRLLVFITPTMMDSVGNKVDPPFGAQAQIRIDSKFVEAPDQVLTKLELQSLFTDENDSKKVVRCSASLCQSLLNSIGQSPGADLLSAPSVVTLLGRQAQVAVQDSEMIAGKNQLLGPSVDFLPTLSADGKSVDLVVIARYSIPAPKDSQ
ncbi:MAG: sigma-70 family RNA polymerase sigma factor [Verrucomicrobiota bacterium]